MPTIGDATVRPTLEDYSPLLPISIYGASKLGSEVMAVGYAMTYRLKVVILRLANVVGPRSNHAVVPVFIGKPKKNSKRLKVLGGWVTSRDIHHEQPLES